MTIYARNVATRKNQVSAFARIRDPDRPPTGRSIALRWAAFTVAMMVLGGGISAAVAYASGYRLVASRDLQEIAAVKATLTGIGVDVTPLTGDETANLKQVLAIVVDLLAPPTDTIRLNDIARAFSSSSAPKDVASRKEGLVRLVQRLESVPRAQRAAAVDALIVSVDAQAEAKPLLDILKPFYRELVSVTKSENRSLFERTLTLALENIRISGSVAEAAKALEKSNADLKAREEEYAKRKSSDSKAVQEWVRKFSILNGCAESFNLCRRNIRN